MDLQAQLEDVTSLLEEVLEEGARRRDVVAHPTPPSSRGECLSPSTAMEPVDEANDSIVDGDETALVDVIGVNGGGQPTGSHASQEPTLKRARPEESDGFEVIPALLVAEGRG
jgi:hypothetical protein